MLKLANKPFRHIKIVLLAIIAISPILATGYFYYPKRSFKDALSHRQEAERRLKAIQQRLDKSITPPLTRYQQLDEAIENYLSLAQSENLTAAGVELSKANQIAEEMEARTSDRWGRDLVDYYRSVDRANVEQLRATRQFRADASKLTDKIEEAIKKGNQIKADFEHHGATCEVLQTNVLIIGFMVKTDAVSLTMELINATLEQVNKNKYLLLQAELLRRRGELLGNTSNFNASIVALEESIKIAKLLDEPQLLLKSATLLCSTYYTTNNNEQAFSLAMDVIKTATENGLKLSPQTVQIAGISSFNLKYKQTAEQYLLYAVALAQKQNHHPHIIMSYTLLGIVQAEQYKFAEAEEQFTKAKDALNQLPDLHARAYIEFAVMGYYGRVQMLAGKIDHSIELYEQALKLAAQTNVQQQLALSQLHQGLGECLIAKGNKDRAKTELTIAIDLDRRARLNYEQNNALLTFAVTHKSSKQQLELLEPTR